MPVSEMAAVREIHRENFVARPEANILGRILAKAANIVNGRFAAAQKANVALIGEIVETAGGIDGSEQGHVFRKLDT